MNNKLKIIKNGNITSPGQFVAWGIHAGIKAGAKKEKRPDLMLLYSDFDCTAAAVFTTNDVKAAPVLEDIEKLKFHTSRAILANSGNANACTGSRGLADARRMCDVTASHLGCSSDSVFVCSTGVIGETLPMEAIEATIPALVSGLSRHGGSTAAKAILTTDTCEKSIAVELTLAGKTVTIGAIAKGSGMISPNMATMLAFITTDAAVQKSHLQDILGRAVEKSFNMITVDGDMSTNDTVIMLANGASSATLEAAEDMELFEYAVEYVCLYLAKAIVADGEGATKFVEITVRGARSFTCAKKIAFSIADSLLVKTALFAEDANWGRFMAAIGKAEQGVDANMVSLSLNGIKLVEKGLYLGRQAENAVSQTLKDDDLKVTIELGQGDCQATVYTMDLSYDYVKINACYRS